MDHRSHQQHQMSSGLTRYRSAPSSYFSSLLSSNNPAGVSGGSGNCGYARDDFDQLLNPCASNSGIKQVFDRFVANISPLDSNPDGLIDDTQQIQQNPMSNMDVRSEVVAPIKQEHEAQQQQQMNYQCQEQQSQNSQFIAPVKQEITQQNSDYSLASQMNYQTQAQQNHNSTDFSSGMDNFGGYNRLNQTKMDGGFGTGGSNSNLPRYNSSPAGFFTQANIENEISDNHVDNIDSRHKAGNRVTAKILKVDKERHRISLGMKNSYFSDATSAETDTKPSSGYAVNGDALSIGIESTSSPESSSQGREDLDSESVDGKDLFLAEVESRASIPPLEVPLDDTENLDMGDVVNQDSGDATNFGTSDDKNQKHAAKKAKRLSVMQEPFKNVPLVWTLNELTLASRLKQYISSGQNDFVDNWRKVFSHANVVVFPNYYLSLIDTQNVPPAVVGRL